MDPTLKPSQRLPASFRDPSGFLFESDGVLLREVDLSFQESYDGFVASGLCAELIEAGLLIEHEEVDPSLGSDRAYRVLRPHRIPFVSYPYEWSFSQLKAAARLTLEVQRRSLARGFCLRDASAFNVQFIGARPVFIDTLSFGPYREGEPWVAYRQFCEHFFAPLVLMSQVDPRLGRLLRTWIDGIPLDVADSMLSWRSRWSRVSVLLHLSLHSRSQRRHEGDSSAPKSARLSKQRLLNLIESLDEAVEKTRWDAKGTEWADYYDATNYSGEAFEHKIAEVGRMLRESAPETVWDLGANNGTFSRLAAQSGARVVAIDFDPAAVDRCFIAEQGSDHEILPLLMDLTNPSPALGWAHRERDSLASRGPCDMGLALASMHHLILTGGVPLARVVANLAELCRSLVLEFVPREDSQVERMLGVRESRLYEFDRSSFETVVAECFEIVERVAIVDSVRVLYRLRRR